MERVAERPGIARKKETNTVSTKPSAPRDLQTKAFEARGFNPLSTFGLRRAESLASPPDRAGDFSPCLPRLSNLHRQGFVPIFQGT
jgi:hypothetical protein